MITTFENRCLFKTYLIVMKPIFSTTYKVKNKSKNTCELYITNWSYSYKVGIFFYAPENYIEGGILGCTPSFAEE